MLIWLALFIPVTTAIVLAVFFHHRTKWWEFAIPFVVSLLLVGGFKMMGEWSATKDAEIWNGWATQARYYEDWNEYIHKTCSSETCTGTGENRSCTTYYYDCSYVDYHPEHWQITESNGAEFEVTQNAYEYLVRKFLPLGGRPTFVDLRRNYHTNDGDMYKADWPGDDLSLEPINTTYSYENRVQASRSVFNYQHIDDEEAQKLGLFTYPKVGLFDYPSILGDCGPETKEANARLRLHNAKIGREKQLRMWVLCTNSSDAGFGQLQESYWVGGNKNEVVLMLGQGWTHIFSWTDEKAPLIEIRDFAVSNREPLSVVEFMAGELKAGFARKNFEEFSYLTVETPTWCLITTFILTLMVNVGLSWFIIHNEWDDDHGRDFWARRNWR